MSRGYRDRSDEAVIIAFVKWYYERAPEGGLGCELDPSAWEGDKNEDRAAYIAAAGAVLYVLANHGDFSLWYPNETNKLLRCGESATNTTTQQKIDAIRKDIHDAMGEDIRRMGRVGTNMPGDGIDADFDMVLLGLAHLLYLFHDDPVSLPDWLVYRILCMGSECEDPPSHHYAWGGYGGYFLFNLNEKSAYPAGAPEGPVPVLDPLALPGSTQRSPAGVAGLGLRATRADPRIHVRPGARLRAHADAFHRGDVRASRLHGSVLRE
jgi:hypothetical protein